MYLFLCDFETELIHIFINTMGQINMRYVKGVKY